MGKAVGGFFRFIFVLFTLGLVGYNIWEVARLRAEVAALRQEQRPTTPLRTRASALEPVTAAAAGDTVGLLAESRSRAERAKALIAERRLAEAQREITLATQAARRAGADARGEADRALAQVRAAAHNLSELSDRARRLTGGEGAPAAEQRNGNERR
jgi:hypothetical protein